MKVRTKFALGVLLSAYAGAAQAYVLFSNATIGRTATVTYTGSVNGSPTNQISATTIFTLNSISDKTWVFSYSITNTSTVAARLSSFGFDATGLNAAAKPVAIQSLTSTGTYDTPGTGDNYPEGFGKVDVCFSATSKGTCTGSKDGVTSGISANGLFTIKFKNAPLTLTLDRFVTRFQSIAPGLNGGGTSGIGKQEKLVVTNADGSPGPVPEPAQWLMLITGFGAVGIAVRRRRTGLSLA